jgi:hypothetical protein
MNTANIEKFITEETFLNHEKFSFEDHEYQRYIIEVVRNNPGCEIIIPKASQMGISELAYRIFLARMAIRPGTAVLLSFPSKGMSSEIFKTRWDTIISESPRLKKLINRNVDSASTKMMLNGSIAYALSGNPTSKSNLLTRPISDILVDECDRQDSKIYNSFGSRTKHTKRKFRLTMKISTPTVDGVGIDAEFAECRVQHVPYTVCEHCLHEFEPDFFEHVRLPGFSAPLITITKQKAAGLDLDLAYLECPECRKEIKKQGYVWRIEENLEGVTGKIGIQLNPFIAPGFITMPELIKEMLTFDDFDEFLNQHLGKTARTGKSTVQVSSIHFEPSENLTGRYICGIDMGKLCHFLVGVQRFDTSIHVTESHIVRLSEFEEFLAALARRIRFSAAVMDSEPYSDLVYKSVRKYNFLYSAIYEDRVPRPPDLFTLKMNDKYDEMVRQININKNYMMDVAVDSLDHFYTFDSGIEQQALIKHFTDMRRVRDYRFEAPLYRWMKSKKGDDHFFHTFTYLHAASRLASAGLSTSYSAPVMMSKIKVKDRA